jgi:hypothetical protein
MSEANPATETMSDEKAMELYGDVPLLFLSYYKYSFSFSGKADDGAMVYMYLGGSSGDIYRLDVERETPQTLSQHGWSHATIMKGGESIWSGTK